MQHSDFWHLRHPFILASASPQRRTLLEKAGFSPSEVVSADTDEHFLPKESPSQYVHRTACQKAAAVATKRPDAYILAADTVIVVGVRIIRKARSEEEARQNLALLSGRRHRVLTGVCLMRPDGTSVSKVVRTDVVLKRLDYQETEAIIASEEWKGVAGYQIEGVLSGCVRKIIGSYPNVLGLPICEVAQMLKGILH